VRRRHDRRFLLGPAVTEVVEGLPQGADFTGQPGVLGA